MPAKLTRASTGESTAESSALDLSHAFQAFSFIRREAPALSSIERRVRIEGATNSETHQAHSSHREWARKALSE